MILNDKGINLIKSFESCRLTAYPDPATGGAPWTIGYGATGKGIAKGVTWTQAQADARLASDLVTICNQVTKAITNPKVTDNQFSAMVSFTYNEGIGNLKTSTLLKLVNANDMAGAANEFYKWDVANGKHMDGLLRRRLAEKSLFLT